MIIKVKDRSDFTQKGFIIKCKWGINIIFDDDRIALIHFTRENIPQ